MGCCCAHRAIIPDLSGIADQDPLRHAPLWVRLITLGFSPVLDRLFLMRTPVIAIYSDDQTVRQAIASALGSRVAADLPNHSVIEFATGDALRLHLDEKGRVDLFILDGESTPEGGMGIARQLKDEIFNCPPTLVITARSADAWLASWSKADASMMHPIDPFTLSHKVADLLRPHIAANA